MLEDPELGHFQAALLELLEQDLPAPEVHRRLLEHPASKPFEAYVQSFDLRCIEVAGRITRKFAKHSEGTTDSSIDFSGS